MDKIVTILENYEEHPVCVWDTLSLILDDHDITAEDVLQALESQGMIDIHEIYCRVQHGIEEYVESGDEL